MKRKTKKGKVYLVGAGPGDPDLLTVKARECLSRVDVIIYDNLANRTLLEYAKKESEFIYVGKKRGHHTISQEEINRLIVDRASKGLEVLRLKGGDPFIFGRGGEEAEELASAEIEFEIIPGVTSAISVPAYAGIPLTHRNYTSTVAFVTGHEDPEKERSDIPWNKLSTAAGTLVFLMGVGNLKKIASALISNGRSPDTPVAVIMNGTLPDQQTIVGKLQEISRMAEKKEVKPPAIIVVGDVVQLRKTLNWYETKPLFGKRIVVTRAREQASNFRKRLALLGAECIEFPTIEIIPPERWGPVDQAIERIEKYDWLIFTSVNGVKFFLERLGTFGKDVRDLHGLKIAAIGPKTAEIWQDMGIIPDLVPDEYRAEAIIECFRKRATISGTKILLPRATEARRILPDELKKLGAQVDEIPIYQTVRPDQNANMLRQMLEEGSIDMVTFTSSSTVNNFMEMFTKDRDKLQEWLTGVAVACIGPVTADTANRRGISVDLIPETYTIEALSRAIVDYFHSIENQKI